MATGGCELNSEEIYNFECRLCSKRNENRKYCEKCQRFCCITCVGTHENIHILVNFNCYLLEQSKLKWTGLKTELPVVPTERCSVHETKVLDMYCQNHDEVGCTTCMELDHRNCKSPKSLQDITDPTHGMSDVEKTIFTLKLKQIWMATEQKKRETSLRQLEKSKVEAINLIFKERLLNEMREVLVKEVESEFGIMESSLKQDIRRAQEEEMALQNAKTELYRAKGNKPEMIYLVIAKKNIEITESFIQTLDTPEDAKVLLSTVGNFIQQMKSNGCSQATPRLRELLYGTREVNIKTTNDTSTCCVLGSCLTQDGKLIIADYNNKSLKRVDMVKMIVIDTFKLSNKPCDVCSVTEQEAAVILIDKTVQFISLGNQMLLSRQINLNHICYGIAYNDDKLYITDGGTSLYIHDMTGNVIKTVTKDNSGNDLFKLSTHIAFNGSRDKLFVTNGNDGVVLLDTREKYIGTFTDERLSSTFGVCVDNWGNMFVSGYDSNNVVQMSQDGRKGYCEVVSTSDRIIHPYSVTVNPGGRTLVISEQGSDKIKVIKLL